MVIALWVPVDKPVDVSSGIAVPPIPVVISQVNHTILLVLFGDQEKAWKALCVPGEAFILMLLGREERKAEFGEGPAVFLLRC